MARASNPFVSNLQHRQLGILSPMNFSRQISGSCGLVKRLSLHNKLEHHEGCVNTLHFNMSGDLLASGSDDLDIVIWDWFKGDRKIAYNSDHINDVVQVKFMPYNDTTIVTCAEDGKVCVGCFHLPSGEGPRSTECLIQHDGPAFRLCIQPGSDSEFLTCGGDGAVFYADLRDDKVKKLFCCCTEQRRRVPLFTICSNPRNIYEFAVGGTDQFARVYDVRKIQENHNAFVEPVKKYCPHNLREGSDARITCLVYSYNGTELLVSYVHENIYLFNSCASSEADYIRTYKGHRNEAFGVMDVNFFGPQSEYIVSGSDCGHIFLWDKQTEEVVQFLQGDNTEADICLEPHPHAPVLATSGFDHNIKLWLPTAEQPTNLDGLESARIENGDPDSDGGLTEDEDDNNDDDEDDDEDDDNDDDEDDDEDGDNDDDEDDDNDYDEDDDEDGDNDDDEDDDEDEDEDDDEDGDNDDDEDDDNDDEDGEFGNRMQFSPS
ncbi:DDB1- and CUL4-associated factor 8-like isoform X2 [Acropora palmata]|uniref:DDB1- and CUL4-associated factor 8-like isoform X2 n=1 Tax=Acropora palmata TaxID=6131 RepID=UPI003DA0D214